MNKFRLNNESERFIHADTGMDSTFIAKSDIATVDKNIEDYTDAVLKPSLTVGHVSPRGSVYLILKRFFTQSEINAGITKIAK